MRAEVEKKAPSPPDTKVSTTGTKEGEVAKLTPPYCSLKT
jgi:hypothetical protein